MRHDFLSLFAPNHTHTPRSAIKLCTVQKVTSHLFILSSKETQTLYIWSCCCKLLQAAVHFTMNMAISAITIWNVEQESESAKSKTISIAIKEWKKAFCTHVSVRLRSHCRYFKRLVVNLFEKSRRLDGFACDVCARCVCLYSTDCIKLHFGWRKRWTTIIP